MQFMVWTQCSKMSAVTFCHSDGEVAVTMEPVLFLSEVRHQLFYFLSLWGNT